MNDWRFLVVLTLLFPTVQAAPDGAELFAQHCAVCHGERGKGGVGTPLALESFLSTVSDEFLTKTIRHGRPGRVMPAFPTLSNSQVKAIVGQIRSWSEAPAAVEDGGAVEGDPLRGKALYATHCAACHGDQGQGGHGTGVTFSRSRELPIIPPALRNRGFLASASDRMLQATIRNGRAGTPMPAFGGRLSEEQIGHITRYLRSWQTSAGPSERAADEPFILSVDSSYDLQQTVENVRAAAAAANFAVIRSDHLEHGLVPEGEESSKLVSVDFCNFKFLFDSLQVDPRLGMFLPCRITVVESEQGEVKVMSVNPRALSRLFNNNELDAACARMYELYTQILEEATL
jgi:cytochrome c oxidase cbb3-type subunit 3